MMGQLATPQFTSSPPPEEIQQDNPPIYRKPEILPANELQETNLLELDMGNVPERPLESQYNPPPRKMEAGYHYPSTQGLPPWSNQPRRNTSNEDPNTTRPAFNNPAYPSSVAYPGPSRVGESPTRRAKMRKKMRKV